MEERLEEERTGLVLLLAGGIFACTWVIWAAGEAAAVLFRGEVTGAGWKDTLAVGPGLVSHWEDPALAWPAGAREALPGPVALWSVLILFFVVAAGVGGAAVSLARSVGFFPRDGKVPGDVAWAVPRDLVRLRVSRPQPDRVSLGTIPAVRNRILAAEKNRGVCVIGAPRSGKSYRVVRPAALERDAGSVVITSVRADILDATYDVRKTRGNVHVFDPAGCTGRTQSRWSPITGCADWETALDMATWLTNTPAARSGQDGEGGFWEVSAADILAPLLYLADVHAAYLASTPAGGGVPRLLQWLLGFAAKGEIRKSIEERMLATDDVYAETVADTLLYLWGQDERLLSNVLATARGALSAYRKPSVQKSADMTGGPVIDPEKLLKEQETLYVVSDAIQQTVLTPVFTALVQSVIREAYRQALQHASGALPHGLLLLLDEAANIAPIPGLPTIASTAAGHNITLVTVYQDLSQIQQRYGEYQARTLLNNHEALMLLPGNADSRTLETFSRLMGDTKVARASHSYSKREGLFSTPQRSKHINMEHRRLASPEFLRTLPPGTAVVIYRGLPPARVQLR